MRGFFGTRLREQSSQPAIINDESILFESLEPRLLLSGTHYVVNSLLDVVADDGFVTLREAIDAANGNTAKTKDVAAGSDTESDLITFDDNLIDGRIVLTLGELKILDSLIVDASSIGGIVVDADNLSRVFRIYNPDHEVSFNYLTITNGTDSSSSGIYNLGHLTLNNCDVSFNLTTQEGGAIFNNGVLNIHYSSISNNSNEYLYSGGIYSIGGTIKLVNSEVCNNIKVSRSSGNHNGICLTDTAATLTGSQFNDNHGAGIKSLRGTLVIDDCIISQNYKSGWTTADGKHGAIINVNGIATITDSSILRNYKEGIVNKGTMDISNCIIAGNHRNGVYNHDSLSIVNSVVVGNIAYIEGSGIYNYLADIEITNCTIVGNSSYENKNGGGVYHHGDGHFILNNSIVAMNDTFDLLSSNAFAGGNNIIGINLGFVRIPNAGDDRQWGTNDDDYGDLHLTERSIAINIGDDSLALDNTGSPIEVDLDGNPRIADGRIDVGAYEFQEEILPDREIPSTEVTTLEDTVDFYDDEISLREALLYNQYFNAGTEITFSNSLAGGEILITQGEFYIFDSVTIDASRAGNITINGDDQSRVFQTFYPDNTVSMHCLNIINYIDGGIFSRSQLSLTNCIVTGNLNSDMTGSGIYQKGASATLLNCTVSNNTAFIGAGIFNSGVMEIIDCIITGNSASSKYPSYNNRGGGIYSAGNTFIKNSRIANNKSGYHGGGVFLINESTVLEQCDISNNISGSGGGIWAHKCQLTINNCSISNNTANAKSTSVVGFGGGGGIFIDDSSNLSMMNCELISNHSALNGGGIFTEVYSNSEVSITNCLFLRNFAEENGGGIYNERADESYISNCRILGNKALKLGGGLCNTHYSNFEVINSIIIGNQASTGGGAANSLFSTMSFTNCTVTLNKANSSGGISSFGSNRMSLNLLNCIVTLNNSSDKYIDIHASSHPSYYNATSCIIGENPWFVRNPSPGLDGEWGTEDDDYGDLRLQHRSPAIDAGWSNSTDPDVDIEGNMRHDDPYVTDSGVGDVTYVDIGAYEATYMQPVVRTHVFYNNSKFDGYEPLATEADSFAIATDKQALRPDESATFENYTSYWRGINGIIIDFKSSADSLVLSLSDLVFKVGNSSDTDSWKDGPLPVEMAMLAGRGMEESDRYIFVWEDNAIEHQWLQITVKSSKLEDMMEDYIFYYGNAVGETGNKDDSTVVDAADEAKVRINTKGFLVPALINDPCDHNRDGRVDATDTIISRTNATDGQSPLLLSTFHSPVLGDANRDGIVGLADLDILGKHFRQTGNWAEGDFNSNGQVDSADLDILCQNWGAGAMTLESNMMARGNTYFLQDSSVENTPTFHTLTSLLPDDEELVPIQLS